MVQHSNQGDLVALAIFHRFQADYRSDLSNVISRAPRE